MRMKHLIILLIANYGLKANNCSKATVTLSTNSDKLHISCADQFLSNMQFAEMTPQAELIPYQLDSKLTSEEFPKNSTQVIIEKRINDCDYNNYVLDDVCDVSCHQDVHRMNLGLLIKHKSMLGHFYL